MSNKVVELGSFEEVRDGIPLKFRISTVPPHLIDTILRHMIKFYLPREPMSSHFKLHEDPAAVLVLEELWRKFMLDGTAIVVIRDGPEDEAERVIGANMTFILRKDGTKPEIIKGTKLEPMYDSVMDIAEKAQIFEKYNVDKYLSGFGLSVDPKYHGYKIGERQLQSRWPLCKILGIKVTGTVFTQVKSQHLSKKLGFDILYEEDYSKYKYNGVVTYKGLPGKFEQKALRF